MEDDRLTRLLRELPPQRARDGFTAGVLQRLAEPAVRPERPHNPHRPAPPPAAGGPRLMVAAAALAVLLIAVALPRHEGLPPAPPGTPSPGTAPRLAASPSPGAPASGMATAALRARRDVRDDSTGPAGPAGSTGSTGSHSPAGSDGRFAPGLDLDRSQARQVLRQLRGEQLQLAHELYHLRRSERPRVIYIGGDEDFDMVVDLSRVPEARRAAAARPPNLPM